QIRQVRSQVVNEKRLVCRVQELRQKIHFFTRLPLRAPPRFPFSAASPFSELRPAGPSLPAGVTRCPRFPPRASRVKPRSPAPPDRRAIHSGRPSGSL